MGLTFIIPIDTLRLIFKIFNRRLRTITMKAKEAEESLGNDGNSYAGKALKMAAPIVWFKGETAEQQLEEIAKWGLCAYEWLGMNSEDRESIREKAHSLGLTLTCISRAGGFGPNQMTYPEGHDQVVASFKEIVAKAKRMGSSRIVGLTGNERENVSRDKQTEAVVQCLKRLAPIAEANEVVVVVEMLNVLVNHAGYFLCHTAHGVEIIKAVNSPNVRLLFDVYHQQISEGDIIRNIQNNIDCIGHFHIADNPGRKEPGTGELNYRNIFKAIAETGYDGYVAWECGHSTKDYQQTLRTTLELLE